MFALLNAYIKSIERFIKLAIMLALMSFISFQISSVFTLIIAYIIVSVYLIVQLSKALSVGFIKFALTTVLALTMCTALPHVVLLLGAIPYIQFILPVFVYLLSMLQSCSDSMQRLLGDPRTWNPSTRQQLINELNRDNVDMLTGLRTILNRVRTTPTQQVERLHYEDFAMPPAELNALRERLKTAIASLPKELNALHHKAHAAIQQHYGDYTKNLSEAQKKTLDNYLNIETEFFKNACPISLASVDPKNPNEFKDFVILEKQYKVGHTYHAARTEVFIKNDEGIGLESLFLQETGKTAFHPSTREVFNKPCTYPNERKPGDRGYDSKKGSSNSCRYVHHPYELVMGHPLTLELCEAMEAFILSIGLQLRTSPASHPNSLFSTPQSSRSPSPIYSLDSERRDDMTDEELQAALSNGMFG
ncbi:MAG: hypothetical protein CK424_01845 [Legionella sp.]|nr:MAG: hypothetical protein CK424_01845 [Legionella sp.]